MKDIHFAIAEVATQVRKIQPAIEAAADKLEDGPKQQTLDAVQKLATDLETPNTAVAWAAVAAPSLANLRQVLAGAALVLADREDSLLAELEELAAGIAGDGPAGQAAQAWAVKHLPVFVYVDEYPEPTGHQNIAEYLGRKSA